MKKNKGYLEELLKGALITKDKFIEIIATLTEEEKYIVFNYFNFEEETNGTKEKR